METIRCFLYPEDDQKARKIVNAGKPMDQTLLYTADERVRWYKSNWLFLLDENSPTLYIRSSTSRYTP